MTFPRYRVLRRYWRDVPPVEVSVAAFIGAGRYSKDKGQSEVAPEQMTGDLFDLYAMVGASG